MAVMELEQKNKLQEADILHISELVAYAIDLKGAVKREETVDSKESARLRVLELLKSITCLIIQISGIFIAVTSLVFLLSLYKIACLCLIFNCIPKSHRCLPI